MDGTDWRQKRQSRVQSSSMIFDDDLEDWRLWPGRIWIIFLDQVIENHYQGKFGFWVFSFYENLLKLEIFQSQTLKFRCCENSLSLKWKFSYISTWMQLEHVTSASQLDPNIFRPSSLRFWFGQMILLKILPLKLLKATSVIAHKLAGCCWNIEFLKRTQ